MPLIARLAMMFAGGAIAGRSPPFPFPFPLLLGLLLLLLLVRAKRETAVLLVFAALGIVAANTSAHTEKQRCQPINDRAPVRVTGFVSTDPAQSSVQLRVEGFCKGYVRARLPEERPKLTVGDEIEVAGTWMTLRISEQARPSTDGMIIATSAVKAAPTSGNALLRARGRTQQRLQQLFPTAYPLAEALLIAQRENLNPDVRESFAASGLTHLLAISGSHVAIVAATLLLIANVLRLSRRAASVLAIVGSTAYVFFLGAPYAALRSLIQMSLLLASRGLQRPAHPVGLLAGAAMAITALDPAAPLDPGFQLSFAGIYGIVMWRRPLIELMPASVPVVLRDAVATTCAATAITTPIAAFHFGTVSVISLVANLLAAPVVALAVPTTAATLALSALSSDAARFVAGGAELTLLWLHHIADWCARVPGGHFVVTPLAMTASVLAVVMAYVALRHGRNRTLHGGVVTAAMAGALPLVLIPMVLPGQPLEIHMIDVGQGDAFAIRSPRGRWLLVDAGPVSERMDAGKAQVVPYLLRHQANRLSAVILSHPHLDHFGGLPSIAERLRVSTVLDPGMAVPGDAYDSLLTGLRRKGVRILRARTGSHIAIDRVAIDFLGPDTIPLDASADPNEYSAAFRLSYGPFSALFLGDMPAAAESELVRRYGALLDVDVLKVGHHGSGGSSHAELLIAASPQLALISAGRRNRYRHPHPAALARLEHAGTRVFRTDADGSVKVNVDEAGRMTVRTRQ